MRIDYSNMRMGSNKTTFALRYVLCSLRSWLYFTFKFRNVEYKGFIRVMKGTHFAPGAQIRLGHNVQFGMYCDVATDLTVGDNVLFAGKVCVVGKHDHTFNEVGKTIWQGNHEQGQPTVIGNDVWLGNGVTVVGPVKIGSGSIVAAGAVVTRNIPSCEIWGGVPARKIADRFTTNADKERHLKLISMQAKDIKEPLLI